MREAALADRAEQEAGEAASPSGADDQEVGTLGGGQQRGRGVLELEPFADAAQPVHLGPDAGHGVQELAVGGVLEQGLVLEQVVSRQRVGGQPCVDHVEHGPREDRLVGRPAQRALGRPGAVDADHDPAGGNGMVAHASQRWRLTARMTRVVGPLPTVPPAGQLLVSLLSPLWDTRRAERLIGRSVVNSAS